MSSTRESPTKRVGNESLELEGAQPLSAVAAQAALDLRVARLMFYGGFAALPWLWFIVWVHFRKVAKQSNADPRLAIYVNRSLVGAICGGVALFAWVLAVQLSWQTWGEFGESIMLVVPEGDEV